MIEQSDAERIARELLGRPPSDPNEPWELVDFPAGWMIRESFPEGFRGGAIRVIERSTGHVVRFPSSVPPPRRIIENYEAVVGRGRKQQLDDD